MGSTKLIRSARSRRGTLARERMGVVRRHERGQALAETAIVITVLLLLAIGTVEFGRAFQISNTITHALRDASRQAAVVSLSGRNSSGMINSAGITQIKQRVRDVMLSVLPSSTVNSMTINVSQPTENGINTVKVDVNATIPYMFNLVGPNFTVSRSVSFRDEGRP